MNAMANNSLKDGWLVRNRRRLLIGGPALFLLIAAIVWLSSGRYVSTDDAYIQAARTDISANIAARVTEIAVRDNQQVHKDDLLFKLDDRDYVIAVEDAKARLAGARLQIAALKATYLQRQADVQGAKDTLAYEQREFDRQKMLAAKGISSQAQLDQAAHALASARQQVNAIEQQRENIRASLGDNPDINVNEHPSVQQAQAMLDRALLNLSHTVVRAPADGIVTKVEQLQVGDYINAATPVFSLISDKDIWVEANFKETDLTHMRPGQTATIKVDTYPGRVFHGRVVSASPGTGSSFSLLPPENATGNWVKVVQRLALRISIDDADAHMPLGTGLSATVEVDTHSKATQKKAGDVQLSERSAGN
jgi:membrane fusion protein (multidrug efflux system)